MLERGLGRGLGRLRDRAEERERSARKAVNGSSTIQKGLSCIVFSSCGLAFEAVKSLHDCLGGGNEVVDNSVQWTEWLGCRVLGDLGESLDLT